MAKKKHEMGINIPDNLSKKDIIAITNLINHLSSRTKVSHSALEMLTRRETEVLIHLASGLSCEEIGEVLSVGRRTVGNHKYSIQQKIETKSMAELTKLAIREGLVSV